MSIVQFKERAAPRCRIGYLIDVDSSHQRDSVTVTSHEGGTFHVLIMLRAFDLEAMEHGRKQARQIIEQQLKDGRASAGSCRSYPLQAHAGK